MNKILEEDLFQIINNPDIDFEAFNNDSFLITGATGLIGSLIVKSILLSNKLNHTTIKMILVVRNIKKAQEMFGESKYIKYIESSIENLENIPDSFDYVIHCATPTKSKFFITSPVETLDASVLGTKRLLEICKEKNIKRFIYLSSMEMYGVLKDENVTEEKVGYINNLDVRSSYSMGKRVAELYCHSYFSEYQIPTINVRLAMCFGAGIPKEDNRVVKFFCESAINGKNIEVKSTGETIINFVYTTDALNAIFLLLVQGTLGDSYNVVADTDRFTVLDMAKYISEQCKVEVKHNLPKENMGYAPDNKMILSNEKMKELGWNNQYNIKQALVRTMEYLKNEEK